MIFKSRREADEGIMVVSVLDVTWSLISVLYE